MTAIVVLYTEGWRELANIVIPNLRAYCAKHGYEYIAHCYPEPYPSDFGFNKIRWIKDIFNAGIADTVMSLDMDCLIANHRLKIEDFTSDSCDFFIAADVHGINAGVFVVKQSAWSECFLDYLLEQQGTVNCEQDAIAKYMAAYKDDDRICVLGHPTINSYDYSLYPEYPEIRKPEQGHFHFGNYILHLPGVGMEQRIEKFKNTPIIK